MLDGLRYIHFQTVVDAGRGNALQACVATALGVRDLSLVPNFIEAPDYMASLSGFLELNVPRLAFVKVDLSKLLQPDPGQSSRLSLSTAPGTLCVLVGRSPRGEHKHCVLGRVAEDGCTIKVVHDPFPQGGGVVAPYSWAGFFVLRLD
jgi:hypothetical protein